MTDPEIPDEAVRAAAEALAYQAPLSRLTPPTWRDAAYEALAAALPALRRPAPDIARNIVNQLADLWEVPVPLRQDTNDAADQFVTHLIQLAADPDLPALRQQWAEEAAKAIETRLLHDPDCETCEDVRDAAAIVREFGEGP